MNEPSVLDAIGLVNTNEMIPSPVGKEVFREKILETQDAMLAMTDHHIDPPVEHFFAPGMYGRQMRIDKGVTIVGKIHVHAHINIISEGVIDVLTETGAIRYEAPITFVSDPLTKRFVKAVEDTIWTTIHATNETDLEKIEAELIMTDYDDLLISGGDE